MSKVTIAGDVNGSGVFTLAAPNGNTNRTLVLPDEAGTMALQGGAGVGKVLQVVQGTTLVRTAVSNSNYAATTLTATITPTSTSSKILVFGQGFATASQSQSQPQIKLFRNGLDISPTSYGFGNIYSNAGGYNEGMLVFSLLDAPSALSAITYTIYLRNNGTGSGSFGSIDRYSVITLMEIAA